MKHISMLSDYNNFTTVLMFEYDSHISNDTIFTVPTKLVKSSISKITYYSESRDGMFQQASHFCTMDSCHELEYDVIS